MFDVHEKMTKFYEDHVRLGENRRKDLRDRRDACLDRLNLGLKKLGESRQRDYSTFDRKLDQGSYAMHTLNQHADNDYDIDVAVIFAEENLPIGAYDARKRIEDALLEGGGSFNDPPKARTNAVTVWYAEGLHVDLAVYRERERDGKKILEHAGTEWVERSPEEVTDWFKKLVDDKSPKKGDAVSVKNGQLRRVVRFVKRFARSRKSWSLPGGMILTALVGESYKPDNERDDRALYETMIALRDRVKWSLEVLNPVDTTKSLTEKDERKNEVKRLGEKLDQVLKYLESVKKDDCTETEALKAWGKVFKHEFWGDAADEADQDLEEAEKVARSIAPLRLNVDVALRKEGPIEFRYRGNALPKNRHLRFTVEGFDIKASDDVRWIVRNTGDEARAANQLTHEYRGLGRSTQWEHTAYKGTHSMVCEVSRRGELVAKGTKRINIGKW